MAITAIRAPIGLLTIAAVKNLTPAATAGRADDSRGKAFVAKLKVVAFKTLSPVITTGIAYYDNDISAGLTTPCKITEKVNIPPLIRFHA